MVKKSNLNAPPPFNNLLFLVGNSDGYDYSNDISIDLGAGTYDNMEISVFGNSMTEGNSKGNVGVYSFGAGPFTGTGTLNLTLDSNTQFLNLGIRLESTTNQSSIMNIPIVILGADDIDGRESKPKKGEEPSHPIIWLIIGLILGWEGEDTWKSIKSEIRAAQEESKKLLSDPNRPRYVGPKY